MIKAEQAREIALKGIEEYLDQEIKEAAKYHSRSLSLYMKFRLDYDIKRLLEENGYRITTGRSGKYGEFDIINW